jgi:hypothetical protein
MTLFFDVLLDGFISHIAARYTKVSACPDVASPELLSQVWKLLHQLVATLPLEHLEQAADRDSWRHAHKQMNVVARHMPFDNGDFLASADFADQFSQSRANFTSDDGFAILRHPDNVQVDAENRVCAMPILCHARTLSCRIKPAEAFA